MRQIIKINQAMSKKEQLEIELLQEQIKERQLPFYRKYNFWKFIATIVGIVTTVGGLLLVFDRKYLDMEKSALLNQKATLEQGNDALRIERRNLEYDIKVFTVEKNSIIEERNDCKQEIAILKNEKRTKENLLKEMTHISNMTLKGKDKYIAAVLTERDYYKSIADNKLITITSYDIRDVVESRGELNTHFPNGFKLEDWLNENNQANTQRVSWLDKESDGSTNFLGNVPNRSIISAVIGVPVLRTKDGIKWPALYNSSEIGGYTPFESLNKTKPGEIQITEVDNRKN